jgi:antitoxin CptB
VDARRLLWRCRRGMKELDIVLERYVSSHLSQASHQERRVLEGLLELPDPVLADYLLGPAVSADPELGLLIAAIRTPGDPARSTEASTAVSLVTKLVTKYEENVGVLPEL